MPLAFQPERSAAGPSTVIGKAASISMWLYFVVDCRTDVKKFESTLARIRCFEYGAKRQYATHTMQMTHTTNTFLAEAARVASSTDAQAPVNGERRIDEALALAERSAT